FHRKALYLERWDLRVRLNPFLLFVVLICKVSVKVSIFILQTAVSGCHFCSSVTVILDRYACFSDLCVDLFAVLGCLCHLRAIVGNDNGFSIACEVTRKTKWIDLIRTLQPKCICP